MTTLPGPTLYQTTDGGSTWYSFAERVFDHGFDLNSGMLVYTNGNSLFVPRPPWTEKEAVVRNGDWRLIAAEFVSEQYAIVADTIGLYRVDLESVTSTRVLDGQGEKWLAARIRHSWNDPDIAYPPVLG